MITLQRGDARRSPFRGSAHLIYADPPTNRGTNESPGNSDRLSDIEYYNFALEWLTNAIPHLEHHATLVICCYPKIRRVYERVMEYNFSRIKFIQEVIWHYDFGLYTRRQFVPSHDNILIYQQGTPSFNWADIAITSQRQQAGDSRADARGRTPGSVWSIPRVPGNSLDRRRIHGHRRSCQPIELCTRILRAYTKPQQLVYDPFAGTGTMAQVAKDNDRNYFGIDIAPEYVTEAHDRLDHVFIDRWKR